MFKPISNYLQIISRQVQLICGSPEPASGLHTPPTSLRWQVPGLLLGWGEGGTGKSPVHRGSSKISLLPVALKWLAHSTMKGLCWKKDSLSPHPKSQDEVSPHKTKCKVSGILSSCSLPPLPHPAGSLLRLPVGRNNLCLSTSSPDPLRVLHSAAFRPPLDSTSSSSGSRDSPSATRPLPVSPVCENGTVFQQNTQTRVQRTILDSSSSPTHQS